MAAKKQKPDSVNELLLGVLQKKFPGDEKERTFMQLIFEQSAKAAIKGNVEAAKLLLRHAKMAELAKQHEQKMRRRRAK